MRGNSRDVSAAVSEAIKEIGATTWYSHLHIYRFIETLAIVRNYIPRGARILDIGVWPGYLSRALEIIGYNVTGIDINPSRIDRKSITFPIHQANLNNLTALPFENASFDGILFCEVIEHINPQSIPVFMAEVRRVAASNAIILATTPNCTRLSAFLQKKSIGSDGVSSEGHGHWREYSMGEVVKIFESAGISILENHFIDFYGRIGKIGKNDYYFPIQKFSKYPRRLMNFLKLCALIPKFFIPRLRDSLIVVGKKEELYTAE